MKERRNFNGFTAFVTLSEHPESRCLLTPVLYANTGQEAEAQAQFLELCDRQRFTFTPGQKFQFPCIVGAEYGISNSCIHSVADCRNGGFSDRKRLTLYIQYNYHDKEAVHWTGRQSYEEWDTPWKAKEKARKGKNIRWKYQDIVNEVPSTYSEFQLEKKRWRLSVPMLGRSAAFNVMDESLRGNVYVRDNSEKQDGGDCMDLSSSPPTFPEVDNLCTALFTSKARKRMKVTDIVAELNKDKYWISEQWFRVLFEAHSKHKNKRWYLIGNHLMRPLNKDEMMDID